ncbi:MAG TPA: 1,4-dihydroxy-2-naphthoate polyprenyltransferase [Bacilli bacterium]
MQPQQMQTPPENQANLAIWWRLMRPHTLTASFVPVLLGTFLALPYGGINISLFLAMLAASLLIQAATNMINEYYDFKRGLDTAESVGIGGAIVRHGVSAATVLRIALFFFALALLLGVYICYESSWWLALVGIICMLTGYLYTGGPFPIAYTPFGELVSGLFMGLVIILISFYIQTLMLTDESVLLSIPISILIGAILMANNIRDREGDRDNGRRTLAILVGHKRAVRILAAMFIVAYLWVAAIAAAGMERPWILLVLLSIPKAIKACRGFDERFASSPSLMMPAMQATAQTNTLFGLLLCAGLLINFWFY